MYSIFSDLRRFHRPYTQRLQQVLAPYQLTEIQWALIRYLHDVGPSTNSDIAVYWGVEKPSVTPIVQKLMDQQLIYTVSGTDKRQKVMHLTDEGLSKYKELKPAVDAFQSVLIEDITAEERIIVEHVLEKLQKNLLKWG